MVQMCHQHVLTNVSMYRQAWRRYTAHQQTGSNAGSAALRVLRQGGQLRDTWHWRRRAAVAVWAQRVCELCADGRFRRGTRRTGPLVPVCLSCVGEARNRPGLLAHGGGWARGAAARCVACARGPDGSKCHPEGLDGISRHLDPVRLVCGTGIG